MRREPHHRLALLGLGFLLLFGVLPATAFSAEACSPAGLERALVGSGDEDESGIGGTGLHDARPDRLNSPGDDSESGIGGTGIFGTVTNLDRLCVNGLEIRVPDDVLAQSSNGGANDGQLAVGMVVWIRATQSDEGLVADQIQIHPSFAGQIEMISSNGQEFVISGHKVVLPDAVQRGPMVSSESTTTGHWLVVYGLRDENETLMASRIEVDQERKARAGNQMLVQWLSESGSLHSVSIEGYVSGSPEQPRLAGLELEFAPSTPGIQREAVRPGLRMTAEGRISQEGVFQIERLQTFDRDRRPAPIDSKTPMASDIEAMRATSEGRPAAPPSESPSSAKSERPRPEDVERIPRRPPIPRSRPTVDRPPRLDIERVR